MYFRNGVIDIKSRCYLNNNLRKLTVISANWLIWYFLLFIFRVHTKKNLWKGIQFNNFFFVTRVCNIHFFFKLYSLKIRSICVNGRNINSGSIEIDILCYRFTLPDYWLMSLHSSISLWLSPISVKFVYWQSNANIFHNANT